MIKNITESSLRKIEKPARYVGGEYNQILKNKDMIKVRWALCFPDLYDIGMSNLGFKILYNILNKREDTWCERAYAVWPDFEKLLGEKNSKLYAIESKDELDEFDILGFTLQYEMSYTNILNMLDMSGIPIFSKDRDNSYPLIVAGGPCSCNPYTLSPFIDLFMIGEGEEIINILTDKYIYAKENKLTKNELLESLKDIQGIFIPKLHTKEDKIKKVIIEDFGKIEYPVDQVVNSSDIVQDKIQLEIFRGCMRGCRFCQAGYIYRPVRQKEKETLLNLARCTMKNTGRDELTLSSLSSSDYDGFMDLASEMIDLTKKNKVSLSLPSLRIDSMNLDIFKKLSEGKKGSFTFAPEAGSQRLRDVINKNITKEDILNSCRLAFENGFSSIKLYFMIGLPTETFKDVEEIVSLCDEIVKVYYDVPKEIRKGRVRLTVSTSTFVPKPHTPFEFCKMEKEDTIIEKQRYLKEVLSKKNIKYSWSNTYISMLEALVARGDEKIAYLIYEAFKLGAKFDSWDKLFNEDIWRKAISNLKIDVDSYIFKEFETNHSFVWDNINHGVEKEFLIREYNKAVKENSTSPNCRDKCSNCGVLKIAKCKFSKNQG